MKQQSRFWAALLLSLSCAVTVQAAEPDEASAEITAADKLPPAGASAPEAETAPAAEAPPPAVEAPADDEDLAELWLESLVDPDVRHPIHFHMLFSGGYQNSNLSGLQQVLSDRGYRNLGQDFWGGGGSVQMVAWNVVTEFEGMASLTMPVINDDYWLLATAGNTFFNLGYQFEPHPNLRIYPLVGLGLSFMDLQFVRRSVMPTFGEFLDNPLWSGNMANQIFALNLGLGLEWQGWLGRVGLRGGYIFHPIAGNWWTTNAPDDNINRQLLLADGPSMRMDGPYLKLVIGF
ncbi:MAG: hypothetical protein IGS03_01495 [Candidatus Sericytochromatia bacterium]|nr:hypothetical protein [Candidatus Sericytochromatia bacterium]